MPLAFDTMRGRRRKSISLLAYDAFRSALARESGAYRWVDDA